MILPENKIVVLFDGVCNLCNAAVDYIIKHDKKERFIFATLTSETGKTILENHKIDPIKTDSIVYYNPKKDAIAIKAEAAVQIAKQLSGIASLLPFFSFIPLKWQNSIYDFVAKNRYNWFGKKESCRLPSPAELKRFL